MPFGQCPQLADRSRHAVRTEPEPVFDLQGQIHPSQAVQSKVVQGGGWLSLLFVERPAEMVLSSPWIAVIVAGLTASNARSLVRGRVGERKPTWAQQVMVRNERGRLDAFLVVPLFQEGVDLVARQAGQASPIEDFDRHRHLAAAARTTASWPAARQNRAMRNGSGSGGLPVWA